MTSFEHEIPTSARDTGYVALLRLGQFSLVIWMLSKAAAPAAIAEKSGPPR